MKEIIIKFNGLGYYHLWQARVQLYDEENNLLFSGETYNSKISFCLETDKVYKMIAFSKDEILKISFYVGKNQRFYIFSFPRSFIGKEEKQVTFLLTDFYYKKLPIEKGEMTLWPK